MKKTFPIILLVLSCLVLLLALFICIYGIWDINRYLNELANNPGASGIDYLGVGWGYGICLFATSTFGLVLSSISRKLLQERILNYISGITLGIYALLIIVSIFVFYM